MTFHQSSLSIENHFLLQQYFLRNEYKSKQAPTLSPHCTENVPNCDLSAEVQTEPWLLRNLPPLIELGKRATHRKQIASKRY